MKTNTNLKHQKTIHQHIEHILRHRISVVLVVALMLIGLASFDRRIRSLMQEVYVQGWSWLGSHITHEHPPHTHMALNTVRMHTMSGPGPG